MCDKKTIVIKAKYFIDGTGSPMKEDVSIFVKNGVITGIENKSVHHNEYDIIDLGDRTVLPGMVDAHMHFFGVPSDHLVTLRHENKMYRILRASTEATKMLNKGITAARCLGSEITPQLRRAINEGVIKGPRVIPAGEFITSTGGTWDENPQESIESLKKTMIADGADELRAKVRQRIREGASVIKVGLSKGMEGDLNHAWGDDPYHVLTTYRLEELKPLTEEAHFHHVMVSAHCIGDDAVQLALDAGVDTIEHGYPISHQTRKRLLESDALVVSTISQLYFHLEAFDDFHYSDKEREIYTRHMKAMETTFKENIQYGVRYALGTDLVGYPTHPQDSAAKEFELAVSWGMNPMSAIVSGTKHSAQALGLADSIGTIEIGKYADMIAMNRDPLHDISALQDVSFVMLGGEVIKNED